MRCGYPQAGRLMDNHEVAFHWENNAEAWTVQSRAGHDKYRDVLNTPAFLDMLPPVFGLKGLDLGCGEGTNTRAVARLGARMVGIDIAPTFIGYARETEARDPLGIEYLLGDGEKMPFEAESFDFVTAFMSLMDMANQQKVLRNVAHILRPGGFLQFSILHPCFVPPTRRNIRDAAGNPVAVEVADYFEEANGTIERWMFSSIPKEEREKLEPFSVPRFHRTLTSWVSMIVAAELVIESFGEPRASEEIARAEPIVADTRVAPIFLHVRARKG